MNLSLRVIFVLILALFVVAAPTHAWSFSFPWSKSEAPQKPAVQQVNKKTVNKKTPKKNVFGLNVKNNKFYSFVPFGFVDCDMPDGKIIKAPKKVCDDVKNFWASVKPHNNHNHSNGGGSSNSGSNNNNNNNHHNPQPTPQVSISSVNVLPCTSASCGFMSTVEVNGSHFISGGYVELVSGGTVVSKNTSVNFSLDAQTVFENGSQIITDFYHLPCGTYDVRIVLPNGQTTTRNSAVVIPCI